MQIFSQNGFGDGILGNPNRSFLNATGDPAPGSPAWAFAQYLSGNTDPAALLGNKTTLTTLTPGTVKDYSWLTSLLSIGNTVASGLFPSESAKATGTLSATDIAQAVLAGTTAAQAQAKADAAAKQTQTLLIAGAVGLVLLVGAYFVFRKN